MVQISILSIMSCLILAVAAAPVPTSESLLQRGLDPLSLVVGLVQATESLHENLVPGQGGEVAHEDAALAAVDDVI